MLVNKYTNESADSCKYSVKKLILKRLHSLIFFLVSLSPVVISEEISKQVFSRAILHHGDPALFGPLHNKLRSQECIKVAFIGTSVTNGSGLRNGSAAYPKLFSNLANSALPCKGQHNVTVFAKGATASDYWVDFLVGRQEVLLAGFDLIIVDTAMNDVHELLMRAGRGAEDPGAFIRKQTETLMALLLHASVRCPATPTTAWTPGGSNFSPTTTTRSCSPINITTTTPSPSLPPPATPPSASSPSSPPTPSANSTPAAPPYSRAWTGAAVLWLGSSTRRTDIWLGPLPRSTDAVYTQLPVAVTHGVPYVSIIDGLGPFASSASQEWLRNVWYLEPIKDPHPGAWGHGVIAAALLHFLTEQRALMTSLPWRDREAAAPPPPCYIPRPPAFVSPSTLQMYLDASPLHIPTVYHGTTDMRLARCGGWTIRSDVAGKPGLITEEAGASCTVVAFPGEVARHPIQIGLVHVLLLKSYEHMGVVRVTVSAFPAVAAVADNGGRGDRAAVGNGRRASCGLGDVGAGDSHGGKSTHSSSGVSRLSGSDARVLGSRKIDCLWGDRVSEAQVEEVPIDRLGGGGEEEVCLAFTFEVVGSARAENKVKVLGVTVF